MKERTFRLPNGIVATVVYPEKSDAERSWWVVRRGSRKRFDASTPTAARIGALKAIRSWLDRGATEETVEASAPPKQTSGSVSDEIVDAAVEAAIAAALASQSVNWVDTWELLGRSIPNTSQRTAAMARVTAAWKERVSEEERVRRVAELEAKMSEEEKKRKAREARELLSAMERRKYGLEAPRRRIDLE